jgi:NADP-reducing hydrogenase subunit HndC
MARINSFAELEKLRQEIKGKRDPSKPCITLCSGTACYASASESVNEALERELDRQGLKNEIGLRRTGCHGFCEQGPLVVIYPEETCYTKVKPEDAAEIVQGVKEKKVIERLLYSDPVTGEKIVRESEIPFYKNQHRLVFGPNRWIDPKSIEDYLYIDGYSALAKALSQMTSDQVLEEVKKPNFGGRGGGGFPAGKKWEETKNAPGGPKYVVVNCDEGDPGAYMDRSLMEGNPHSVIEGLIIGAYAIGSHKGFVYVRQEYPLAVENLNLALEQAGEYGLLGENILSSGFDFSIKVHRGAGAFVSGESSALMIAMEGKAGEPRMKYTHMSQRGYKEKPTCLNNVETWATVPFIINKGSDWFNSIGTKGSKGTKIFSLVGKVNNTGLVEIPMGMTLRQIIYDIGGGIPKGRKFKGVQTGGPSGGIIPAQYLDSPIDFDELTKIGSMMGSGGMIVMDEDTCMVDMARYFVDFCCEESCGKCIPCREGLRVLSGILTSICEGEGKEEELKTLERVAEVMKDASLCALGATAANPVLTTLKYFRDEYEAHIKDKRCPAKVCKNLINYYIDPEKCGACMICLRNCPTGAVQGGKNLVHWIEQDKCIKCGICYQVCPERFSAVEKLSGEPVPVPIPGREVVRKKE